MNTPSPSFPRRRARLALSLAAVLASVALGACATTPPPTAEMALSTAAVAHAAGAGANELAPAQMQTARDKLARANTAMSAKNYDAARSLAEEARVDAQLAEARAEAAKATKAADEVQRADRALREEMNRKAQ